jgi:hypothetical protein
MVTIQLPKDFKEFLALLNLNQVKYLIVDGIKINFINLKYLKENKKNCHRLKDLNDLENLP